MDEEDGRPGALAAQAGHLDASNDAPTVSLRFSSSHPIRLHHSTVLMRHPSDGHSPAQNDNIAHLKGPKAVGPTAGGSRKTANPKGPKAIGPTAGGGEYK